MRGKFIILAGKDMMKVDDVLDEISSHPTDEQETIVELARKRLIDARREEIFQASQEAEKEYREGKIKFGNVKDLLSGLDNEP